MMWVLLLISHEAVAAKVPLDVITPRWQFDVVTKVESPIEHLTAIRIEWGTCTSTTFTRQASMDYAETRPGVTIRVYAYPTDLSRVCVRAYAVTRSSMSDPSNAVVATLSSPLGKPVTLGQPVVLPPAK
jgi:hypothetical protein